MTLEYDTNDLSVSAASAREPERVALIAGKRQWTYRELVPLIDARAAYLVGMQSEPAQPVGFVARTDVASILWLLAAIEAGVPVVPVHPRLTDEERSGLRQAWPAVRWLDTLPDLPPGDDGHRVSASVRAETTLAIVQTSGTTGPQGVSSCRVRLLSQVRARARATSAGRITIGGSWRCRSRTWAVCRC